MKNNNYGITIMIMAVAIVLIAIVTLAHNGGKAEAGDKISDAEANLNMIGRYKIEVGGSGDAKVYKIDTITGQVWYSHEGAFGGHTDFKQIK